MTKAIFGAMLLIAALQASAETAPIETDLDGNASALTIAA
jgi:hypothetical protein